MTNEELVKLLQTMPPDAEVFTGYSEGAKDKLGWSLYDIEADGITYEKEVWSYGNCSPRPPSIQKNVIIIERC